MLKPQGIQNKIKNIRPEDLTRDELILEYGSLKEQFILELSKNELLMEKLRLKLSQKYNASREKTVAHQITFEELYPHLFNEMERTQESESNEEKTQEITYQRKKKNPTKSSAIDLSGLETQRVNHEPTKEECTCSVCKNTRHKISEIIRPELQVIPAKLKVLEHVSFTMGCRNCETTGIESGIIKSKAAPTPLIPKSVASASLVSSIMHAKYINALPLYRQEKEFKRMEINITRQSMSNWMMFCSKNYLEPIFESMKQDMMKKEILHVDETEVQVIQEEGRKAQNKSYMWLYCTGKHDTPIILYEYQPSRSGSYPKEFLKDFGGYLHADGYKAYERMAKDRNADEITIRLLACLSHIRRKFTDALKSIAKEVQKDSLAHIGVRYCDRLFRYEEEFEDLTFEERYVKRLEKTAPLLEEFHGWLLSRRSSLSKFAFTKAVDYALNQWSKLLNVLKDGRLEISNNLAERSIKPFVIGRKNWLFSNTARGAKASAIIYSVVETAKQNNINPQKYLQIVFERLPTLDFSNHPELLKDLLPYSKNIKERLELVQG